MRGDHSWAETNGRVMRLLYKATCLVEEADMRRLAPVLLPIITMSALLVVASVFPPAMMLMFVITAITLVTATIIVAVFRKNTAMAGNLLATLIWSLVLFELVLR
jgi:hypothetical protein